MRQTQNQPRPTTADMLPYGFVRMAAVVRLNGPGRSTIYRLTAEDKPSSPVRLVQRAVARRRIDVPRCRAGRPTVSH